MKYFVIAAVVIDWLMQPHDCCALVLLSGWAQDDRPFKNLTPLSEDFRKFQTDFSAKNPWFRPVHIKGRTHFPTLESPGPVAAAISEFYAQS